MVTFSTRAGVSVVIGTLAGLLVKTAVTTLAPVALAAVLAGWLTGAFAGGGVATATMPGRLILPAFATGIVLEAAVTVAFIVDRYPLWMMMGGLLLTLPLAIAGGWVARILAPRAGTGQ